jgi:hypothetical protein
MLVEGMKNNLKLQSTVIAAFIFITSLTAQAESLSMHLKRLTSALSSRNLDSLRALIDPNRVYVEISPKEGSFLSPSQTLAVIESFFRFHPPVSFSYVLVKEQYNNGIAIGSLSIWERGKVIVHRTSFGFQKNKRGYWVLVRIIIR